MNDKTTKIALEHGIFDKIKNLEEDLLKINGIVDVDFDLTGFYDGIPYVIFLPEYEIPVADPHYYAKKYQALSDCIETAAKHQLARTGDGIEDYGKHFYIVTEMTAYCEQTIIE